MFRELECFHGIAPKPTGKAKDASRTIHGNSPHADGFPLWSEAGADLGSILAKRMPPCFAVPFGQHACVQWVDKRKSHYEHM
jgi:hypothetical protein